MSARFSFHRARSALLWLCLSLTAAWSSAAETQTRNVLLVTIDGLRWQEVFRGADETLLNKESGGVPEKETEALRREFWADTADARRRKLMPFFWGTVVARGQAFGNRDIGSVASVLNPQWFSYPGYNELLTGRPDPLVVSNAPIPNRNITVLEWLQGRPGYAGRVAASAEWSVFPAILNVGRSRLPVFAPGFRVPGAQTTPRLIEMEEWMRDVPEIGGGEHFDAFPYHAAVEFYDRLKPRVYLLALGEPDVWAHARRYDRYLASIQRCDRFVRQLCEKLQALPEYRDTTSIVLTPDHGRGAGGSDWTSHGSKTPRSNETWLAVVGPDTPPRGERRDAPEVHQAQVAATVAALLGEDFRVAFPEAAPPLPDLIRVSTR